MLLNKIPRLIIVSGKGGVGKTFYSLALSLKYLDLFRNQDQNKYENKKILSKQDELNCTRQIKYINFENQVLPIDFEKRYPNLKITLTPKKSTQLYVSSKLKSQAIASWILKTNFFQAIYGMLPGLGFLIKLGHILDMLKENDNLHIVLDASASGHLLSLLTIPSQFKQIFREGILSNDIIKMLTYLHDPNFTQIHLITQASKLAVQESIETHNYLTQKNFSSHFVLNNTFTKIFENSKAPPPYFQIKINQEDYVMETLNNVIYNIPHIVSLNEIERIDLAKEKLFSKKQETKDV